jgi:L-ribulose-5-phosphate 3-epimerase
LKIGSSIYTYLWECGLFEAMERCAKFGFEFIELATLSPFLSPENFGPFEKRRLKRFTKDLGVKIYSLNPTFLDLNLISLNSAIRKISIQEIQSNIRLAADLDAEIVVIGAGKQHPLIPSPLKDTMEIALESISECLKLSSELGIKVAIENLPYSFISTGEDQSRICQELNSPYFKILFDVANAHMVEDVSTGLDHASSHLEMVHFSDTKKSQWGHLPLGMGELDFKSIRNQLESIGYNGPILLETTYQEDPDEGIRQSVNQLQYLKIMD